MVKAYWSGSYPCKCSGRWTLEVNGIDVTCYIPKEIINEPMDTYGTYQSWHFEDWMEVFEDYEDGLDCGEWIEKNKYWLDIITNDINVQMEIFNAISVEDWRYGECGGCI